MQRVKPNGQLLMNLSPFVESLELMEAGELCVVGGRISLQIGCNKYRGGLIASVY